MNPKIAHLQMIQIVVNRMTTNSFALKGWLITLLTGLFIFAKDSSPGRYSCVCVCLILMFWYLDSYCLTQERLFRDVYNRVRLLPEDKINFSMKPTKEELEDPKNQILSAMCAKIELPFYVILAIMAVSVKLNLFSLF